MVKKLIVTFLILGSWFSVFPQVDRIIWQRCLGTDNGWNKSQAIAKSKLGYLFGIELAEDGDSVTDYHGNVDAWIVSTDLSGNTLWERCYGGSDGDSPHKIININDSTYFLVNTSISNDGDHQNQRSGLFWIVKINAQGEILWENSYGGSSIGEEVRDAILMRDNGLLLMCRIGSTGGDVTTFYGQMDIWFCRIDSSGNILWQKTFGNAGLDNAIKIKLTSRNTVLMIGCHDASGGMIDCPEPYQNHPDVWLIEIGIENGEMLNQWCYGGTFDDQGQDVIEVDDGYVFAASTNSNNGDVNGFHGVAGINGRYDFWIVKIDFFGNIVWQKCLGGNSDEYPVYLTETEDKGIIVIGNTSSFDGDVTGNHSLYDFYYDIWVTKLDSSGNFLWGHCFGGAGTEKFWMQHSVLKIDDYDYVLGTQANYLNGDVECDLFPDDLQDDAWLFEIKDCTYYLPNAPVITFGPDTLCTIANPVSFYSIDTVQWATGYQWKIEPESAGSILSDSVTSQVTWNPLFEGLVTVQARGANDCGYSAWSEPFITQVYSCMGVEEPGGMEAWGHGGLEVWPNPARDWITLTLPENVSSGGLEISVYKIFKGKFVVFN